MTRRGLVHFALMSVIWGIPYLFIRVAVADVTPAMALGFVLVIAGSTLATRRAPTEPASVSEGPALAPR